MKMDFNWESVNGLARALGGRVELLEKVFKEKGLTPAMIQKIVASGFASDFFDLGDEIVIPWTDYSVDPPVTYQVPHVVVHFGDVEDPDGNVHENAMWLMWKYATPYSIHFDEGELIAATESNFQENYHYYTRSGSSPFYDYNEEEVVIGDPIPQGTTYYKHILKDAGNIISFGSDDWSQSAARQLLNSNAEKAEWWVPQHECDVIPKPISLNHPGFLTGYSDEWLNIFKKIKVDSVLDKKRYNSKVKTTYDTFFLPSFNQVGGHDTAGSKMFTILAGDIEGEAWEYFLNKPDIDRHKIYKINEIGGSLCQVFLRSAYSLDDCQVMSIFNTGLIRRYTANSSCCLLPSCVLY